MKLPEADAVEEEASEEELQKKKFEEELQKKKLLKKVQNKINKSPSRGSLFVL